MNDVLIAAVYLKEFTKYIAVFFQCVIYISLANKASRLSNVEWNIDASSFKIDPHYGVPLRHSCTNHYQKALFPISLVGFY